MLDIPPPSYRTQRAEAGMDPDMKRMGVIAGAIMGGIVVLAGAWSLTRSGAPAEVPVIHAPSGPLRVKPEDPGGMAVIGAVEEDSGKAAATLAPAPETPELDALKARLDAARAAEAAANKAAHVAETAASKAAQSAEAARAAAPPAPFAPPVAAIAAAPAPEAPVRAAPPKVAPTPAGVQVQLAALGTEAAVRLEWERLSHRLGGLLANRDPAFMRVDRPGKSPFWRLRTGGFGDMAAARRFCDSVRAKGASCAIATF